MDNKKIGKLIADLRKKQGLTQQELGDKVGVGFRAVSKWERGLTLPDISIINELSKILGISSDELLTGKVNNSKSKKKLSPKVKVTITIAMIVIIVLSLTFAHYSNKTYEYDIRSLKIEECYVEGKMLFNKDKITLIINKIDFKDTMFKSMKIKNYEYDIRCDDEFLFRYGYMHDINGLDTIMSIKEFENKFNTNNIIQTKIKRRKILNNNIILTLRFVTENNEEITKNIELILTIPE